MTDTPITDARTFRVLSDLQSGTRAVVDAEVAQGLEREHARLYAAATALYEAGHWYCDRPVDEGGLWTELRDALGRDPGGAPKPLPSEGKENG